MTLLFCRPPPVLSEGGHIFLFLAVGPPAAVSLHARLTFPLKTVKKASYFFWNISLLFA